MLGLSTRRRPTRTGGRRRRRTDNDPPVRVIVRGLVVLALLGVFGWLGATFYNGVPGRDYLFVRAAVPEVGSLIPHDQVRLGGVRVGQVRDIAPGDDGEAVMRLQLEPGSKVPSDSKVVIRANGLLGARFVELVPGQSERQVAEGATLKSGPNSLTFGVTDALDVFDDDTRGALRPLVGELGTGLRGQGTAVNGLLSDGARYIDPVTGLFTTLNSDQGRLRALLPSLDAGMTPLDANRKQLTALLAPADRALKPMVVEREATRRTLTELPPTLDAATSGLGAARPLLGSARALSGAVLRTLPDAPGGLRATTALLQEAPGPLKAARPLLRSVKTTVPTVTDLSEALDPALGPVQGVLGRLGQMSDVIGPYQCDVENFGAVFRSMTGFGSRAPGGPIGPPMQFRLQAVAPSPETVLGATETAGLFKRKGLEAPCTYLSRPYPAAVTKPGATP